MTADMRFIRFFSLFIFEYLAQERDIMILLNDIVTIKLILEIVVISFEKKF